MKSRVTVTKENSTGRNTHFRDNRTNTDMTRAKFVQEIQKGNYEDYHIRTINGVKTPVSNPDSSSKNNLDK